MNLLLFAHDRMGLQLLKFINEHFKEDLSTVIAADYDDVYEYAISQALRTVVFHNETELVALLESERFQYVWGFWPGGQKF